MTGKRKTRAGHDRSRGADGDGWRYRLFYERAPVGLCVLNRHGLVLEANHAVARLLRVTHTGLLQRTLYAYATREQETALREHLGRAFAGRGAHVSSLWLRRADGRDVALRIESELEVTGEGGPRRCRTALIDINAAKHKEARMRRLAAVVDDSDDAILVVGLDGRILSFNRGAQELYGYSRDEALKETIFRLVPDAGRANTRALLDRLASGQRVRSVEADRVTRHGQARRVSVTASALPAEADLPAAVSLTERDITARGAAEAALGEQESRLRAIVDAVVDAIITTDESGTVEGLNPGAERIFGYAAGEIVGSTIDRLIPSLCPERHEQTRDRAGQLSQLIGRVHAADGVRKDGSRFPARFVVSEIRFGVTRLFGLFVRDLTEEKRLHGELRQSQKMELIGALTSSITHDLNNLLQIISGYTNLALASIKPDDPARLYIEKCRRTLVQTGYLTRQLLVFKRKGKLERRAILVDETVIGHVDLARHLVGELIEMRVETDAPGQAILAEEGQLEQILMNLIVNARDAMPQGGTITLETDAVDLDDAAARALEFQRGGRYIRLTVSDTGLGMDDETRRRLFEPFFTTKRPDEGTGLGMTIVSRIVAELGGRIDADSEVGKGTRFVFHFPAAPDQDPVQRMASRTALGRRRAMRVLLVDEDRMMRRLIRRFLARLGWCEVVSCSGGQQALERLDTEGERVHAAIVDAMSSGMDARSLSCEIRHRRSGIPILFTSAYPRDQLVQNGWLDPDAPLLTKPFDQGRLERALDAMVARSIERPTPTVLVVEDSAAARLALEELLGHAGYCVLAAGSAEQAKELAAAHGAVDLLLTDLQLPDAPGEAVAHDLRITNPRMKTIVMSGGAPAEDLQAERYVHKPLDMDTLVAQIESVLRGSGS